jgi:hypothetical protein
MAFLSRRADGRVEIRETRRTLRGPRSRTLASFRGALTPDLLDAAEGRAGRALDRERLIERASELGIPTTLRRSDGPARALLAQLHSGVALDPLLAEALRQALDRAPEVPVPEGFAEVVEWIGAGDAERGHALRGLLRVSDRIASSRGAIRRRPARRFPRFESRPAEPARSPG